MTYREVLRFLYALGNELKTAKFGLERISILLRELGDPQHACRFVHVAGTNGKGSTCALIESSLRQAGVRTGLYTSPHLTEPTERIQICGQPVSREQFSGAFNEVHGVAERLLARGDIDFHPTFFETVTAMAFWLFRDLRAETVVLEVGLGGRLDATNVVTPDLSVITVIDFDHEAYLGHSLTAIAGEKAGILKLGVPAVFSRQRPEAEAALAGRAAELGVAVTSTASLRVEDLFLSARGCSFRTVEPTALAIECPFAGEHQVENILTALAALEQLGIPATAIEAGIRTASWPGRLELVGSRPDTILDGAHNPSGARALAAYIDRFYAGRRIWILYGAMRDKSVGEIGGILFPMADELVFTAPANPRAVRAEALRAMFDDPRSRVAATLEQALEMAREARPEDAVFVTGSLFLVGEARQLIQGRLV